MKKSNSIIREIEVEINLFKGIPSTKVVMDNALKTAGEVLKKNDGGMNFLVEIEVKNQYLTGKIILKRISQHFINRHKGLIQIL